LDKTIDQRLSQIIADIERMLGEPIPKPRNEVEYLIRWGLTLDEIEAWLELEPDFARRNFTDLDRRRRFDRTVVSNTYIGARTPSSWRLLKTQFAFRDAGGGVNPTLKACSL